jgi:PleD family two-component response regulator
LTGAAAAANLTLVAHVAEALEALLKDLHEKPKHVTKSPLRTVASAIDLLALLLIRSDQTPVSDQPPRILIVDDEPISRRAIAHALERTKLTAEALDDPAAAYNLLSTNRFDLIFLDVDMPGMSGFELCTKLRALPMHKETPVIFVTSLDDFESRANSSVSGGTDFITKPFLFIELGLKALAYILRGRLANPPSASPDA